MVVWNWQKRVYRTPAEIQEEREYLNNVEAISHPLHNHQAREAPFLNLDYAEQAPGELKDVKSPSGSIASNAAQLAHRSTEEKSEEANNSGIDSQSLVQSIKEESL